MQALGEFPEKMTSLGEVQKIIGLSLSKIQLGRSQRGGLPLHKNLLVATVLNKARDLYMKETMYMNYKMMTGQPFGVQGSLGHPFGLIQRARQGDEIDDHEDDSESDVEDECDEEMPNDPRPSGFSNGSIKIPSPTYSTSNGSIKMQNQTSLPYPASTVAAMMMQAAAVAASTSSSSPDCLPNPTASCEEPGATRRFNNGQLEITPCPQPTYLSHNNQHSDAFHARTQDSFTHREEDVPIAEMQMPAVPKDEPSPQPATSDEGFIDDPDCDCDARNFSTLQTQVPFQYCYHCAPFQSANGRGPTLVPTPSSCPSSLASNEGVDASMNPYHQHLSSFQALTRTQAAVGANSSDSDFTIYDMDSKSTECRSPCDEPQTSTNRQGTKRFRRPSASEAQDCPKRVCYEKSYGQQECNPEGGLNNKVNSDESFHPAFRYDNVSGHQAMEIDQITSLVSIFSFGQHIMAAAGVVSGGVDITPPPPCEPPEVSKTETKADDSDSESDTSSDSGHSSEDLESSLEKSHLDDTSSSICTKISVASGGQSEGLAPTPLVLIPETTKSSKLKGEQPCLDASLPKYQTCYSSLNSANDSAIMTEQKLTDSSQQVNSETCFDVEEQKENSFADKMSSAATTPKCKCCPQFQTPQCQLNSAKACVPECFKIVDPGVVEEDSDSESDTSSDSGHSSDDLENSVEKSNSASTDNLVSTVLNKSKRAVSTPNLCSV